MKIMKTNKSARTEENYKIKIIKSEAILIISVCLLALIIYAAPNQSGITGAYLADTEKGSATFSAATWAPQSDYLTINSGGAYFVLGNILRGITFQNINATQSIAIDKINVSWNNSGTNIIRANFSGSGNFWTGSSSSPALLEGNEVFNPSASKEIALTFDNPVALSRTIMINKDAYIDSNNPARTYGVTTTIRTRRTGAGVETIRSLLEIDLSSIPSDALITNATLILTINNNQFGQVASTHSIFRITNSWNEGTGDNNANNAARNGTTWNERWFGTNWNTAGGDYDAYMWASAIAPRTNWANVSWDITSLAKNWKNGTYSNYGLIIRDMTGGNANWQWISSDNAVVNKPRVLIEYRYPVNATIILEDGSQKTFGVLV